MAPAKVLGGCRRCVRRMVLRRKELFMLVLLLSYVGTSLAGEPEFQENFVDLGHGHGIVSFAPVPSMFHAGIVHSLVNVLGSVIPLHIFSSIAYGIVPDLLEIFSPTHGVGEDVALTVPVVLFRVLPAIAALFVNLILAPFRLLLLPLYLILLPLQFLIKGAWFLFSLRPKFLLRTRLWLSKILGPPILRFLQNILNKGLLNLRRFLDLFKPTQFARLRLALSKIFGPLLGFLASIRPRIQNFLKTARLFLQRLLRPIGLALSQFFKPTQFARIRLAIQRLLRPGFYRILRPFRLGERFRIRYLG